MEVKEQSKTVEFWLTKEEKNDSAFREALKPVWHQYKLQKYLVAVFLSGEADLYQQTRELLLYNRQQQAEREVQAAKREGLTISSCRTGGGRANCHPRRCIFHL